MGKKASLVLLVCALSAPTALANSLNAKVGIEFDDAFDKSNDTEIVIPDLWLDGDGERALAVGKLAIDEYEPSMSDEVGSNRDVTLMCGENINFGLEQRTSDDPFVYEPASISCSSQMQVLPGTVVKIRPQAYPSTTHLNLYFRTDIIGFRFILRIPRIPGLTYTIRDLPIMYYLAIQATGNVQAGLVVVDFYSE